MDVSPVIMWCHMNYPSALSVMGRWKSCLHGISHQNRQHLNTDGSYFGNLHAFGDININGLLTKHGIIL